MTRNRNDNHSTEFGLWLRGQRDHIGSHLGFLATNIDFVWTNYHTNKWIYLEEKRYLKPVCPRGKVWQAQIFEMLDSAAKSDLLYFGFYIITFEKTNPDDGKIYLKRGTRTHENDFGKEINKNDLLTFLRWFKKP